MIKKILILSILILSIGEVCFSHEPPPLPAVSTAGDMLSKACTACIALPRSIQLSLQRTYMTKRAAYYKKYVETIPGYLMGTGKNQVFVEPDERNYRKNPYLEGRNSPFDHLAPRNKFDQRILQFDPEDATTVGFDIQIKINAKEED